MKLTCITVCSCVLWFVPALAPAQKTEVRVHHGKVRAETDVAKTDVPAGRKATILSGGKPVVSVSDPLVDDVMKLYKWVQEEKQAERQRIDTFNITVVRVDDDQATWAYLTECTNHKTQASDTFVLGINTPDDVKYYDVEGNLLPFELERVDDDGGLYTITYSKPVAPGGTFRFISVASKQVQVDVDSKGILRHLHLTWNVPYCLNYCRIILPPSAVFVESSRPVLAVESVADRVALTSRAHTGLMGDGKFHFAFLWPGKDNTTLLDVPGHFRGLRDQQKEEIGKQYRAQLAKIQAGLTYHDQSTPLKALLSLRSAAAHKDEKRVIDLIGNPGLKEDAAEYPDEALDYMIQGSQTYEFLRTPSYPEDPQDGDKHPIKLCRKGSLLHDATVQMVFDGGKWYLWDYEPQWTSDEE